MLIDEPQVIRDSADPILMIIGDQTKATRLQRGVYQIGHFGSSAFLNGYEHYPDLFAKDEDENYSYPGCYGVCDGIENLMQRIPMLEESKRQFVITLKRVDRDLSNKGQGGGWRWHKWGQYIGAKEPTTEYLDDEPEIDHVFCYHIYERLQ